MTRSVETDYLVVGAGAAGMAFADSLVAASPGAEVVLVDRRHRPGGHWNDAYPFVRLHLPSATYGVSSRPLGNDELQTHGPEAGLYERASGAEILDYYGRVLDEDLVPTGRVTFLGLHDYVGDGGTHRLVSRLTGETTEVTVRRRLVDATYLETSVPATHTPSFAVAPGARVVTINQLASLPSGGDRYVVVGAGKTGIDACLWLLDNGVDPERIRWVRPRDMWMLDRAGLQPRALIANVIDGLAADLEAVADAESYDDLFPRLEERGRLLRIDPDVEPAMYHCASVSRYELERLREIRDVVRLGRVLRIERDRAVFERGELDAGPGDVFVDCSARGLRYVPQRPVFEADRVTVQHVQYCSPTFSAALIGFVEAVREDVEEQNRLCPPHPLPDVPRDWVRLLGLTLWAASQWRREPDVRQWVDSSRLSLLNGARERADDPRVQAAQQRYADAVRPGAARLMDLMSAQ